MDISTCVESNECISFVADASNERESPVNVIGLCSGAFNAFAPSELMHLAVCVAFITTFYI